MRFLSDDAVAHLREITELPDLSATRYELVRELGRGGMGVVYEVRDRELERTVAMKVVETEWRDRRGAEEARIIAALEHPGIVPIHDAGTLPDGRLYYTMKLVRGVRLDAWAQQNHGITERLRLFARICEPVAFAHANGVVHRDLKPENVMVGEFGVVLVMDWGIIGVGTPGYMAPEQGRGEHADVRSDVYSLGALLAFLIRSDAMPRPLAAVIARAMAGDPAERYEDADALAEDVLRYLDQEPVSAYRENIGACRAVAHASSRAAHADGRVHRHARDRLFLDACLKETGGTVNPSVEERNMNKILVGVIVGALLGAIDGATAWFTPAVRAEILAIILSSTVKGIIAGVAAGWYARRVQSVPKGIAFGFFIGLLLAFIVAALTPEHYWWQIMVPGSILGGVIGWATQRYGRPGSARGAAATAMILALVLTSVNVHAHDHDGAKPTTNAAFEKLKGLAGTWSANMMTPDGDPTTVEYRVTAGGSVVMETMFVGKPEEMINMYTVDGDSLIATHYCSGQNQPVLKLNAEKSSGDRLVFDFVKVTGRNTASYINGVHMKFGADGKVEEEWHSSEEGPHMRLFLNTKR